jgi:hypothetical protein
MTCRRRYEYLMDEGQTFEPTPQTWSQHYGSDARRAYQATIVNWILRMYAGVGGMPGYADRGDAKLQLMADLLGVPILSRQEASAEQIQQGLAGKLALQDHDAPKADGCAMRTTIDWLADAAGLNAVERDILERAICPRAFKPLKQAALNWGELNFGSLVTGLSLLLGQPISGEERLRQLRMAMSVFCGHKAPDGAPRLASVLIFEEADDVFRGQGDMPSGADSLEVAPLVIRLLRAEPSFKPVSRQAVDFVSSGPSRTSS